jgi:hypothetical protein
MWRWARWIVLVAGVMLMGGAARPAWVTFRQWIMMRRHEEIDAKLLTQMQREFPIGTPRAQVMAGLHTHDPTANRGSAVLYVWLDEEPSSVWYCNLKPFLVFSFPSEDPSAPLTKIERQTTGECL